ncbi:arginine/ornithine ABC transporter permease protein AotQ [Oleiphilus messinensis]|uniref:Arginine/ornithine ABC transporter permease protein AotQ n=1 Tax=Oleiphilus messinensis TaxID=141451 RepID=A0A1Y0I5F0_9GAMM|nr:ABC transporter permease [Oleiphilus messinensis]ARU55641.1 arginine/ornithine ABC transporter permease protein AotQ [Oleiphilus messinensis]
MFDLEGYGPSIFKGAILTCEVAFLSLFLAIILGLLGATAKLSNTPPLRAVATGYTTLIRGVPDLVLMLLIYFGGQVVMNAISDWLYDEFGVDYFVQINEFVAGVITIGFIFGAYMTETFRGAFLAVDRGQIEAGIAYGMTSGQRFRRILFPQMMRHALPGLMNNWLVLLKTTALVSILGLADMVRLASEAAKQTHEPFKFLLPVALVYLILTSISEIAMKYLNHRYSAGLVNKS